MSTVAAYNETATLLQIDNQAFYNANLGPFLAGLCVQIFMMGVLSLQCWTYFEEMAANDTLWHKCLVGIMFVTGAFQTGTDFEILYDSFIIGYGRILYWDKYNWTFTYELGFTAFIALVAQVFFIHRCWVVSRSYVLLLLCGVGAAVSFGAGVAASVGLIEAAYYTRTHLILVEGIIWLIATALTDIVISVALIVKLRSSGRKTSFRQTERMLTKLIRLAFETASLTSLIAILNLILYAGYGKQNSIHLFFQFIVGKTYSHSVMVTLLSRKKIRSNTTDNIHVISDDMATPRGTTSGSDRDRKTGMVSGVAVTTTSVTVTDPPQKNGRGLRPFKVDRVHDGAIHDSDENSYPLSTVQSINLKEDTDKSIPISLV